MALSNIELLSRQVDLDPYGLAILVTDTSHAIQTGADFPAHLVPALREEFLASHRLPPPERPRILDRFAPLVDLEYRAGPVYLIPPDLPLDPAVHIEHDLARLTDANPGNWHPVEWRELLDGKLGPVTIATIGDRVASICHTPGPLGRFNAEAGVWTHADFRGRGLASGTVAAWSHVDFGKRHLFYSTDHDNLSSQRVAARLSLPLLGWTHRLALPRTHDALHPLCSLRT
ncbi:MAG: GNAT family N-acetyltransferase [Kofleriaceae bacterium]